MQSIFLFPVICDIKRNCIARRFTIMEKKEVLSTFTSYCDRKMLNYYLYGRTLYDAMKSQTLGDKKQPVIIAMPRDDFDRLHEYNAESRISNKYKLTGLNAKKGSTPYAVFGCLRIYPLDGVPTSEKEYEKYIKEINEASSVFETKNGFLAKIKDKFASKEEAGRKVDELARKYDFEKSEYIAVTVQNNELPGRVKKEDFLAPYVIKIDGEKYNGTAGYYDYLTKEYGEVF